MTMRKLRWIGRSLLVLLLMPAVQERAQNSISAPPPRTGLLLPEANRPPDKNDQMLMKQKGQGARNFDALNTLRRKQINDDSVKLLILANDLKKKVDALGSQPVPPELLREAAVIELLARDVQTRMTVMVGSD
ncbi:MAG TPA: hypothetical protein VN151_02875 [Terracidiphilus sp.]|nr:hypothetical protein [Terracidiphilus sp.]